jgi:RimJ/RimL family protein N-acetyltransferase
MRKCGYREVGRRKAHYFRNGRWLDEILTEVHREDWEKLSQHSE